MYEDNIDRGLDYTAWPRGLYPENPWEEELNHRLQTEERLGLNEHLNIAQDSNLFNNLFAPGATDNEGAQFAFYNEQLIWPSLDMWTQIDANAGVHQPQNVDWSIESEGQREARPEPGENVQGLNHEVAMDNANSPGLAEEEHPQLYDPLGEGGELQYTRRECDDGYIYEYASAGKIIQHAGGTKTRWDAQQEINEKEHGGSVHGIWKTARKQEDAEWMSRGKASQAYLTDLLKTERFKQDPPNFKTIKNLNKIIETQLSQFGGPKFKSQTVRVPGAEKDSHTLVWRNPQQTLDHLIGTPRFRGKIAFAPTILIGKDGVRRYGNMETAEFWNLRQRGLPLGTTLGAGIMMSDAAQLSQYTGDVTAHGVYISLGNIDKSVREDTNEGAWLLVAIIPKSDWDKTLTGMNPMSRKRRASVIAMYNRRLFHHCMRIITEQFRTAKPHKVLDPEGHTRSVQYELSAYGADLEEQCDILGISRNSCPHGEANGKKLGNPKCPPRSSRTILAKIAKVIANYRATHYGDEGPNPIEFMDAGRKYGLSGVDMPFWADLPHFDICRVLSPDLLHGIHKLFFDHYNRWNINAVGAEEYDTRLKAQIPTPDERMFLRGVTKLKQLAGKDWRALFRVHLAIVAGASSAELTKATRAMSDCVAYAQLRIHTELTLKAFEQSLETLDLLKEIWIRNGSKTGKKGKLIKDWAIPKKHVMGHAPEHIRQKGTMDNYNTETMEHLHSPVLKDGYKASNRKGWLLQIVRRLNQHESMREYREFLQWLKEKKKGDSMEIDPPEQEGQDAEDEADDDCEDEDEDSDDDFEFDDDDESDDDYDDDDDEDEAEDDEEDIDDFEEDDFDEVEGEHDDEGEGEHTRNNEGGRKGSRSNQYNNQGRRGGGEQTEQAREQGRDHQGPGPAPTERPEHPERQLVEPVENRLDGRNNRTELQIAPVAGNGTTNANASNVCFPTTIVPYYRVAKKPVVKPQLVSDIERRLGFPKFLQHLQQHPYFATLPIRLTPATLVNVWKLIYITTPTSPYCPTGRVCRIFSHSGLEEKNPRRWDSAFYIKTNSEITIRTPELERIHGRIALLFALKPSAELPEPRLMAYVQRFSPIPKRATGVSGFYAVSRLQDQTGQGRYEVIAVSQIARPCPLSPQIKGSAIRGVEGQQSFDCYSQFYINKYRNPNDFLFINSS
ncbi:hypothetical protein RhiJN_27095 [Ceratobasidium sp. AG-Ba]|nr:hypothetical protein RhiJN_27095 [Ceratobasidium sp. AG-Ba]